MKKISLRVCLVSFVLLTGCASPHVVDVSSPGDDRLTCSQLEQAYSEAGKFKDKAVHARGVTGTNVAAAVFFWPGLVGTYINTDQAIAAAHKRQEHLQRLMRIKHCFK